MRIGHYILRASDVDAPLPADCWRACSAVLLGASCAVAFCYATLGPDAQPLRRQGASGRRAAHSRQPDAGVGADRRGVAAAAASAEHAAGADRSTSIAPADSPIAISVLVARRWRRASIAATVLAADRHRAPARRWRPRCSRPTPTCSTCRRTPMTEPLLFGLTTLQVLLLTRWVVNGELDAVPAGAGWVDGARVSHALRGVADHRLRARARRRSPGGAAARRCRAILRRARAARALSGRHRRSRSWCSAASRSASGSSAAASSCRTRRCGVSRRSCSRRSSRASTLLGGGVARARCADQRRRGRCVRRPRPARARADAGAAGALRRRGAARRRVPRRASVSHALRDPARRRRRGRRSGSPSGCCAAGPSPSALVVFVARRTCERPPFDRARADGRRSAARSRNSRGRARGDRVPAAAVRRRHHHGEHGLARPLHARDVGGRLRDSRLPARGQRADLGQRLHARPGAAGRMGAGRGSTPKAATPSCSVTAPSRGCSTASSASARAERALYRRSARRVILIRRPTRRPVDRL